LRNNSGTLIGFVKIMRDLTDQRKAEDALRRSQEHLQLIIESAKGFAIFTTTEKGIINSWNTGAAQIFGWQEDEILGKHGEILFTQEDRKTGQPQIEMATAASKGIAPDVRWHLHKNGSLVFIEGFTHPFYESTGKLNGFVKIGRDMTAQHTAETALRNAEEAYRTTLEKEVEQRTSELKEINNNLRYANENLQQFASIASHDLQEPLRKIKMFASVLHKNLNNVSEEGKQAIHKITQASDRMSQLIREVLQYSKIAYGTKEFVPTDLMKILQNVLEDLDLLLKETGSVVQFAGSWPVIDAIPLQMHQLFYNLLTNAIKFRKNNVAPIVRISVDILSGADLENFSELSKGEEYIRMTVSDNGIGFDPQFSQQIFQIFERLHPTEEFEGTGVGLALCKKIIENHRGEISAASKQGEGSVFKVILPARQLI
jgi:PAS domain S-box-containing protein